MIETEEERQRIQAEYLRKAQEQVAMLSQSAMTPEALAAAMQQAGYDPAGKEAMLATMLRGGQEALYGATPKGTEIGDIYVAPSWSESLNAAAQKALGGYQMGRARKEQAAIDEQRAKAASAKEQVAAEAARVKQLQAAESNVIKILDSQGDAARAQAAMDQRDRLAANKDAAANNRLTRTLAAKAAGAGKTSEITPYQQALLDLKREQMDRQKTEDAAGPPIDPVSRRRLKQEESVFNRLGEATNEARALQQQGKEIGRPFVDYVSEKAEGVPLGGETLSNYITNKGYSPDEMNVRGKIDGAVEQYRRAFTGANLTLIEKMLGKNWDPTASGISTTEKIQRAENLMNVLNTNRETFDLSALEKPEPEGQKKPEDMTEEELAAELGL